MKKKYLIATFAVSFSLIALVLLGIFSYIYFFKVNRDDLNLSAAEKRALLQQILENNSRGSLETKQASLDRFAADDVAEDANYSLIYPVNPDGKSYYYSKTTVTEGPAADNCAALNYTGSTVKISTWESYSYSDETGSWNKNLSFTDDGSLVNYSLSESSEDMYSSLEYLGGKYAIKTIYNYPDTRKVEPAVDTVSEPDADVEVVTETDEVTYDSIDMFFGEDADILSVEIIDGVEHYLVQYSYEMPCDISAMPYEARTVSAVYEDDQAANEKIVERLYVNKETLATRVTEMYLNSVSDENLIVTNNNETESSDKAFADVAGIFEFEYEAEVTEHEYTDNFDYESEKAAMLEYVENNNVKVLSLEEDGYQLGYINFPGIYNQLFNTDLYYNRDYYPEGELGEDLYQEALANRYYYAQEEASVNYNSGEGNVYMTLLTFDPEKVTLEELEDQFISPNLYKRTIQAQLRIGSDTVTAELHNYQESDDIDEPKDTAGSGETSGSSEPSASFFSEYAGVLEYKGILLYVSISGVEEDQLSDLQFQLLDSSNTTNLNAIKAMINSIQY